MRLFKVGDVVVLRAEGKIGEVVGTMKIEGAILYIIDFYEEYYYDKEPSIIDSQEDEHEKAEDWYIGLRENW